MYQVLYRIEEQTHWAMFSSATSDPFAAMRLLQQAKARHGEATVVQASTPSELALIVRRMLRRDVVHPDADPAAELAPQAHHSLATVPNPAASGPGIDRRRWAFETGPGGDHDQPYHFEPPLNAAVAAHWLRLLARHHHTPDESSGDTAAVAAASQSGDTPGAA